jgi:trimethylamine--corrinoid protein Co-methyltransferase
MVLAEDACYYGTGSDCPTTIDPVSGKRRICTKKDVGALARFGDALPNIDFVMSFGIANDAPAGGNFVHQYEAMLLNTEKPAIVTGHGRNDMRAMAEMAAAAVGGTGALEKRPPLILYSEPFSPLVHTDMGVAKALVCCELGVPFIYIGSPMMGATGPVSLEGALVQTVAESLSGLVIFQNKKPGAKFIFGGDPSVFDMSFAQYSYGAPELNILNAALADMAHNYRLPFFCIAGASDAKTLDAQAGLEYALSIYGATMNGCNLIHDCGYLESGLTSSFESVLFADEVIGSVKHMMRPLIFDDTTVPLDLMNKIGPGGNFLQEDHTLERFRSTFWFPRFLDRSNYEQWERGGSRELRERLRDRARSIYESHPAPMPEDGVVREIRRISADHRPDPV